MTATLEAPDVGHAATDLEWQARCELELSDLVKLDVDRPAVDEEAVHADAVDTREPQPLEMPEFIPPESEYSRPVLDQEGIARHQIPKYQALPLACFPEPVREFISAQARTLRCDPSAVALPVLSVLASALGGTQRIRIKRTWSEPAILWTALVANGQTTHDAALLAATEPLRRRQSKSMREQKRMWPEYEQKLARYRSAVRRSRDNVGIPVRPQEPVARRTVTADWTIPSLVRILKEQPRGVLVCPRELDGWLGRSLGNGCRAALDRQTWFDLHAGESVVVETRSSRPPVELEQPSVSLTGTLSEELLSQKLAKANAPCGLASQLLFAFPPVKRQRWTAEDVEQTVADGYATVVDRLFSLSDKTNGPWSPAGAGMTHPRSGCGMVDVGPILCDIAPGLREDAQSRPRGRDTDDAWAEMDARDDEATVQAEPVTLSPAAQAWFVDFVNDLGTNQVAADEVLFGWSENLAGQAARLALVLHLARWGAGEQVQQSVCDLISMQRGIALARWFAYEAQRVVTILSLSAERRDQQRLLDWLHRRGGPATARDLCRSNSRKYPTLEAAVSALERLGETQAAVWVEQGPGAKGGRPTRKMEAVEETVPELSWIEQALWQEYSDRMLTYYEALYEQTGVMPHVTLENLQKMFNGEIPEPDMSLVTMPEPTTEVLSAAEILAQYIRPQGSDWRPAVDGFGEVGRPVPNASEVSSGAVETSVNAEFVAAPEVSPQPSPELVGCVN